MKEIIEQLAKHTIPVSIGHSDEYGVIYEISGFSKSGTATLFEEDNRLWLKTRYDEVIEIESFSDISSVAFEWYLDYKDREPFESPDKNWLPIWVKEGRLKEQTYTKYIVND